MMKPFQFVGSHLFGRSAWTALAVPLFFILSPCVGRADPPAQLLRDPFPGENAVPGHVYRVAFSPDGKYFFAAGDLGIQSPVRLYGTGTIELENELFTGERSGWTDAQFSPDSTMLVSWGSTSHKLYVWDVATGKLLRKLEGHKGVVGSGAFSPDGKRIVSGSSDGTLRIWETSSGKELRVLTGNEDGCVGCFAPKLNLIFSCGKDCTIRGWDATTGNQIWKQPEQEPVGCGNLIASGNRCFSTDGEQVLSLSVEGAVRVWSMKTGKSLARLECPAEAQGALFLNGGKQVAVWTKRHALDIFEMPGGKLIKTIELGDKLLKEPDNVVVNSEGTLLLSGHADRVVQVHDIATGKKIHSFQTDASSSTRSLAFSPDSRLAAGGSFRGWVYLWRLPELEKK